MSVETGIANSAPSVPARFTAVLTGYHLNWSGPAPSRRVRLTYKVLALARVWPRGRAYERLLEVAVAGCR